MRFQSHLYFRQLRVSHTGPIAHWVPHLLTKEQMQARVAASEEFVSCYRRNLEDFLGRIITMDESSVAFHTLEMKSQSKQWLPKGSLAPLKGKNQGSRKKQIVFAFFDDSGSVYEHFAPVGDKINSDYVIEVL